MRDVERVVWMKKAALNQVLAACGITGEAAAGAEPARYVDLPVASLVEHAIRRDEGELASNGALVIKTGAYTGRSPKDRFIVDTPEVHGKIAWGKQMCPLAKMSTSAYAMA